MPYSSRSQQRMFHYLESQGKMPKKTVREFDDSTDYHDLPEHVENHAFGGIAGPVQEGEDNLEYNDEMMPHFAYGGHVPDENFDEETGNAEEFDSTGEPHTEDELEDRRPMEYMSMGGMAGMKMRRPSMGLGRALMKRFR